MNNLGTIDIYDFYYNGSYLSSHDGVVAGRNGFKEFSLLPSREDQTESVIGVDGEILVSSKLEPRQFSVPVLWNDISGMKIRNIAEWLDTPTVQDFYFKNDTMKLKAKLDKKELSINNMFDIYGMNDLSFIAYDPYFYEITPTVISTITNQTFTNIGNKISFPDITVTTSAECYVLITFSKDNVDYHKIQIKNLNGTAILNSSKRTIKDANGVTLESKLSLLTGSRRYPYIEKGSIKVTVSGAYVTSCSITPNFRWI